MQCQLVKCYKVREQIILNKIFFCLSSKESPLEVKSKVKEVWLLFLISCWPWVPNQMKRRNPACGKKTETKTFCLYHIVYQRYSWHLFTDDNWDNRIRISCMITSLIWQFLLERFLKVSFREIFRKQNLNISYLIQMPSRQPWQRWTNILPCALLLNHRHMSNGMIWFFYFFTAVIKCCSWSTL